MPKWDKIEDVPPHELPPLAELPAEPSRQPSVPEAAEAERRGRDRSASEPELSRQDPQIMTIINTLTRIEALLRQMAS